jgi:hypothetical protein
MDEFIKACPLGFCLHERCSLGHPYKYFACGKGCVLGVLFEDSLNVYFEWVAENGRLTDYGPELRYKYWPKHEFARLVAAGVWETTFTPELAA